jgi:translin
VTGAEIPSPETIGVEDAPYLNGIAEAIGEARRHILDLLRHGQVAEGEATLSAMDDLYTVLVTMDYPDAITGNLRRSTDVARSLIEKTRGDLSVARVSQDLHDALERHARDVLGKE